MNTETPDPDGKLLCEKLRAQADKIEADPKAAVFWRLYDGATQPMAYPHAIDLGDGKKTPGAIIQMSERHWIWAPHDIAFRLALSLAWATTESAVILAEEGTSEIGAKP